MKKRILVFDDDEELLAILEYIINDNGWELFSQLNCNKLLVKVREVKPDLIIMNNWIPDMGGVEATRLLKKEADLKKTPVIFFSANTNIEALAREAGADTYIPKPFELDDMEKILRDFLDRDI